MIIINSLSKYYSKNEIGINNLSFDIPNKGLTIIIGESGSGKTTLLNLLSGLIRPSKGTIVIDGVDITKLSDRKIARYRGKNIGFIFQDYKLIERWTVKKNISYACELAGIKITKKEIEDTCISLELIDDNGQPLINKKVANLSGGQKQRVAIARAIIKKPKILLCDEPTGALDKENSMQVIQKLRTISQSIPVVIVTHDESLINETDCVVRMSKGEIANVVNEPITEHTFETQYPNISGRRNPFVLLKTAFNCLLSKKITVILSMLLCGLSLFAFSLPLIGKSATRNYQDIQIDTLINRKLPYAIIRSDNIMVSYENDEYNYHYGSFSDDQIKKIKEYNNFSFVNYSQGTRVYGIVESSATSLNQTFDEMVANTFSGEIHFSDVSDIEKFGYVKDERVTVSNCLPNNPDEFIITDFQADSLLQCGFIPLDSETHKPASDKLLFNSIDELIGFKINGYTICGIYKSPASKVDFVINSKKTVEDIKKERLYCEYHFLNETIWITSDDEMMTAQTFVRLDKGAASLKALLRDLPFDDYDHLNVKHKHNVCLQTPYDGSIELAIGLLNNEITQTVLLIVSCAFGLISFALILFTLNGIFALKKKELGIACCLGGSKAFNVITCLFEALLIIIGSIVATFAISLVYIASTNSRWNVAALTLMPFDMLLVFGIGLVLGLIACALPIIKISKSEIVDLVKEQE